MRRGFGLVRDFSARAGRIIPLLVGAIAHGEHGEHGAEIKIGREALRTRQSISFLRRVRRVRRAIFLLTVDQRSKPRFLVRSLLSDNHRHCKGSSIEND
jgi:hypothetical protein